jgi:hypothetical protein
VERDVGKSRKKSEVFQQRKILPRIGKINLRSEYLSMKFKFSIKKNQIFFSFLFLLVTIFFFQAFFLQNKLPIPSDTIIGLYHPFRDLYAKEYPNGIPYKNFLITDPVRQQIPWRNLSIDLVKQLELPLWNPYSFAGTPLHANFQTGSLYVFNALFLTMPFTYAWSLLIFLQPVLGGLFLYLYLKNLKLTDAASFLGGIVFAFSGFSIAWLEWGTIGHTVLWLPLILLATDKIFLYFRRISHKEAKTLKSKFQVENKKLIGWVLVFIFSLCSGLFAGHLQTFFYLLLISVSYVFSRWLIGGKQARTILLFVFCFLFFAVITFIQWGPTLQFILLSARSVDQSWQNEGWFIPWQHLIQFIAPDFFGNPATLNYWGVWNYGEFIGYIGILPLIMVFLALIHRRDKKTLFFGTLFFLSLLFALPTYLAKIPYIFQIPFLSTSQPTRLLFVTVFSGAILSALGLDNFLKKRKRTQGMLPVLFIALVFISLWTFLGNSAKSFIDLSDQNIIVAKRNLLLPTALFVCSFIFIVLWEMYSKTKFKNIIISFILLIAVFDLLRFGSKFTPFTNSNYFFPQTKAVDYLQKQKGNFRIMSVDDRILPPNFSAIYRLQDVSGYDPLYLRRFAELVAAIERDEPNIDPPFGFNRIISPKNFESRLFYLMGVRYVLSLNELKSDKLKEVFKEGQTRIYENANTFTDRVFIVEEIIPASDKKEAIKVLFDEKIDLRHSAVVENWILDKTVFATGSAKVHLYKENKIVVDVVSKGESFLVLMDSYYPTWKAVVCDTNLENCISEKIFITNYNFRGILVPAGKHKVVFQNSLF